ncbi:MAG: RNase adapter RapZ [Angelakisella sp.]
MELLIVTGMSGSGKSKAINALEDIGYFCMDNIPPQLISRFLDLYAMTQCANPRVAMVVDARGGAMFDDYFSVIGELAKAKLKYKILFLDCDDDILFNRYKESRRKHPLMNENNQSLEAAIAKERHLMQPVKDAADYVIDTSNTIPTKLKNRIMEVFSGETGEQSMLVHCMSFGFKNGLPPEADLVFDVRCLPNPFYVAELKEHTGLEAPVRDYIINTPETQGLIPKLTDLLDYLVPLYIKEGKSQLVVAVGCTGGKHRSVAMAELLGHYLIEHGIKTTISHRDKDKPNLY